MRTILLCTSILTLAACVNPHRDPIHVGADAAQDAQAAEAHVRSHMAINACPPGTRAVSVYIATGSDAFIGIRNGTAESSSAANGIRRQQCVGL